jgi:hypothetical protein
MTEDKSKVFACSLLLDFYYTQEGRNWAHTPTNISGDAEYISRCFHLGRASPKF